MFCFKFIKTIEHSTFPWMPFSIYAYEWSGQIDGSWSRIWVFCDIISKFEHNMIRTVASQNRIILTFHAYSQ